MEPFCVYNSNMFIISSPNQKIIWTSHSRDKMRYYRLSEQRIKRVLRNPLRVEEGVAPRTIAVMQPAGSKKHPYEIWVMYQLRQSRRNSKSEIRNSKQKGKEMKIISAWRYPGKSPKRNPIPEEILQEIQDLRI